MGTCPSFEVKFFSDGRVSWNDLQNVAQIGVKEYRADANFMSRLNEQSFLAKYFDLADRYPKYQVWDAPATITYLELNGKKKQITNYGIETPNSLRTFEYFLDSTIRSLGMNPAIPSKNVKPKAKTMKSNN